MSERRINICAAENLDLTDNESWVEILSRFGNDIRARTSVVVWYSLVGKSVSSTFNDATIEGQFDIIAANGIINIMGQA